MYIGYAFGLLVGGFSNIWQVILVGIFYGFVSVTMIENTLSNYDFEENTEEDELED